MLKKNRQRGKDKPFPETAVSGRLVPPPLSLPVRDASFAVHDLEEIGGDKKITKEDYYEQIRKKPIMILETPFNDMHLFTSSMAKMFTQTEFPTHESSSATMKYNDICTVSQIWIYLDQMVDSFVNYFFPRSSLTENREDTTDKGLQEIHLIGLPRMRIVRVRNNSCYVTVEFKDRFSTCFGHLTPGSEDRRGFGQMNSSEWIFSSSEETGLHSLSGEVSTYGGGGFYKDFPKSAKWFRQNLQTLKEEHWIDGATRAVIFDITVYNANINLFCIIKLLFEIPPTGGVIPSVIIHTLKLIDIGSKKIFMVVCLVIFILLFIFYTVEEFYEMTYFRWQYMKSFWNILDVGIVLSCYLVIATNLFMYVTADSTLASQTNDSKFCNFDQILYVQITCNWSLSLLIFFSWIKILKYFNINQTMHQLQAALRLASRDIMWYTIIFMTIFFNLAFLGTLLFGFQVKAFRSTWESAWTLLRAGVGDFDFLAIEQARPLLGPLFFMLLVFLIPCVFVAMYIAILLDKYLEVRSEIYTTKSQMKIGDVLQNWVVDLIAKISNKMAVQARNAFTKRKLQNKFQDVRFLLIRCGFSELEINMFLAKYEISEERVMTEEDLQNVIKIFHEKGVPGIGMAREIVMQSVTEKLDVVEEALAVAHKKTTLILNVLQAFEARQTRRLQ